MIFLNAFFISNGDDEHKNEVSETGSFLLRIFCAIKKAEDAVDIQVTHVKPMLKCLFFWTR